MPLPTDNLLAQQWHLGNTGLGLFDLNVRGVWNPAQGRSYTGFGVRAVVIDNGFDYNHSDLNPHYNFNLDHDYALNTNDAFGNPNADFHGTAVMGLIGAAANGTGAVGVAFDTNLVGYRTLGTISNAWLGNIAASIHDGSVTAGGDVINISQGIANDANSQYWRGYDLNALAAIKTSIGDAVDLGRGGLGTTIVKSAGNSRGTVYDVNADGWTADTRQVVVAAVNQDGFISAYSSYGSANLVSGFGSPGAGQVVTTDRVGAVGYSATDFTTTFNGTSAAAPMVAGVVSLMYEANPGLGWRDVQDILAYSARHVGSAVGAAPANPEKFAWGFNSAAAQTWNGGGLHYSNDYGYGLVDALGAVRLAESWLVGGPVAQKTSNQASNTMDMTNVVTNIPDGNAAGVDFTGTAASNDQLERVTVKVTFTTTWVGDLTLKITSPSGTVSDLKKHFDFGQGTHFTNYSWTFETQAFRGENAAGTWTVNVSDPETQDSLSVSDIVVTTFGRSAADLSDRYVFTNEYHTYAGLFGHTAVVTDTNGGIDVVNAAAVSSASAIRFDGGNSLIDGVSVKFANIENAIGSDGGDTLTGGRGANLLYGMRGNDVFNGIDGDDTAVFAGNRSAYTITKLASGALQVVGPEGTDTLVSIEHLKFADQTVNWSYTYSWANADTLLANFDGVGGSDVLQIRNDGNLNFFRSNSTSFSFNEYTTWGTGGSILDKTGDFNGDGKADVVQLFDANHNAYVWTSNGESFNPYTVWGTGFTSADRVGDFNGDGKVDIIQILPGNQRAYVWTSTGTSFNPVQVWGNGSLPTDKIANVDEGGPGAHKADLVQFLDGSQKAYVATSTGSGFNPWVVWGTGFTSADRLADFDGDGRNDAIQILNGNQNAYVWLSTGASFAPYSVWGIGFRPTDQIADLNGDGRQDVVQVLADGNVYSWLSTGTGFNYRGKVGEGAASARVADVTGDGKADLIQFDANGNANVWRGDGLGGFSFPTNWGHGVSIANSSPNADGLQDFDPATDAMAYTAANDLSPDYGLPQTFSGAESGIPIDLWAH